MPIRRSRNAPVTLALSYFLFDWIASCCETVTTHGKYPYFSKQITGTLEMELSRIF